MKFGITGMDAEHERIIALAAEVEALVDLARPAPEVQEKFHELVEVSLEHFRQEQAHMEKSGYPGAAAHQREHAEIAEWLAHLETHLAQPGIGAKAAAEEAVDFLTAWIDWHLREFDQPAADYMKERAGREVTVSLCNRP